MALAGQSVGISGERPTCKRLPVEVPPPPEVIASRFRAECDASGPTGVSLEATATEDKQGIENGYIKQPSRERERFTNGETRATGPKSSQSDDARCLALGKL